MTVARFPHPRIPGKLVSVDLEKLRDLDRRDAYAALSARWDHAKATANAEAAELAIEFLRSDLHDLLVELHRRPLHSTSDMLTEALRRFTEWTDTADRLAAKQQADHWGTAA